MVSQSTRRRVDRRRASEWRALHARVWRQDPDGQPSRSNPGRRRVGARRRSALRQRRDSGPDAAAAGARLRVQEPARAPRAGPRTLGRIRALAVPPAWRDVWICADPRGHLQATGRDARSRKQYRYHPMWTAARDETKYGRMEVFGRALPALRRQIARDLRQPALSRERVLATVVTLLEKTLIRVGNDEYARANRSFGLTTLENRHVRVRGARVHFKFRAKSGVLQVVEMEDAALARSVKRCQDLPGQELFQYLDTGGARQSVDSSDVNAYVRAATGQDFTAKDFRTWAGTVLAACALARLEPGGVGHRAQAAGGRGRGRRRRAAGQHPCRLPALLHPSRSRRRSWRARSSIAARRGC